jgi:hypothetical protein
MKKRLPREQRKRLSRLIGKDPARRWMQVISKARAATRIRGQGQSP